MAMTITEADAVTKLIHFVVSGELYTGQSEAARGAAASLEYLGQRAGKVLSITPAGDLATYAERLAPLATGSRNDTERVLRDVAAECDRQVAVGWTPEHDDRHSTHDMVKLATTYAGRPESDHPDHSGLYSRRRLVQATALLVAAIKAWDRRETS